MPQRRSSHSTIIGERMRIAALPILLIALFFLALTHPQATAQSTSNTEKDAPQRWMSHQMFQPPPGDSEKNKLSDKTIEEIRRLYLEAEKEAQARNQSGTHQQQP
jgi:hypothetical protein